MAAPLAVVVPLAEGTAEAVARAIKLGLHEGRYAPGQRMIEAELAASLGVGRGSVREALRALAAEGVIELELHRGARVRQFTRTEVLALSQVREALEGFAAALAAENQQGGPLIAQLRTIHHDAAAAMQARRIPDFLELNTAFHETIFALSGNAQIIHHVRQAQIAFFRLQTRFFTDAQFQRAHAEHEIVLAAITASDAPGAEAAMRRHVCSSRQVILNAPDTFFQPVLPDAETSSPARSVAS